MGMYAAELRSEGIDDSTIGLNSDGKVYIKTGGIATAQLASSSVTTAKITDSNVTTAKIADSNVTTAKIADSNVTTAKIADSNVTTAKIADDAVTSAKIAAPALRALQITADFDDFTDGGAAIGTFTSTELIPKGAVVARTLVSNVTGFAGDVSAAMTVGDGTAADRYNTGTIDVFSTADALDAGVVSGTMFHSAAKNVVLTVTTDDDYTSVTAGSVTVTVFYYQDLEPVA